jgi:threonine dehydratase
MPPLPSRIPLPAIDLAADRIDPVFLDTPQYDCEPLSDALGCRLVVKVEALNPIRSFKGRGADLLVSRVEPGTRLLCASAGNFGQAMAYACRKRGVALTVYAAEGANPLKIGRMRALGAEVVLDGEDFDAAKLAAKGAAEAAGVRFVEDSLDLDTVLGAGTMALELLTDPEPFDAVLVPLGNGAMLNGIATVMRARSPGTERIAVQAAGAPAMVESWRSGRVVEHAEIATIADGIGVRIPVPQALRDMEGLIDEALLVSEGAILEGMRLIHQHVGVVPEPSAAVGVAALLENRERFAGRRVATVLCGGNLTPEQMAAWLG